LSPDGPIKKDFDDWAKDEKVDHPIARKYRQLVSKVSISLKLPGLKEAQNLRK